MSTRCFVGLDLGQAVDFTALAVLERLRLDPSMPASMRRPCYHVRHLYRFPLGTPYPRIVESMEEFLNTPPLPGCDLAVDQTGVGRAVVDLLTERLRTRVTCTFWPITITAGHDARVSDSGHGLLIPKKELISTLQVLLQTRRLAIPRHMPEADVLAQEMSNFRVRITDSRNETFGTWREGQHDDLLFALALAAWVGEKALPALDDPPPSPPPVRFIT